MTERPGYNMDGGAIETTDRPLDVALNGDGFIAVNDKEGNEAYTRFGSFEIDVNGNLRTTNGLQVLSDSGDPMVLPAMLSDIQISNDGTISGRPQGADSNVIEEFGRIKLVKPDDYKILKRL